MYSNGISNIYNIKKYLDLNLFFQQLQVPVETENRKNTSSKKLSARPSKVYTECSEAPARFLEEVKEMNKLLHFI